MYLLETIILHNNSTYEQLTKTDVVDSTTSFSNKSKTIQKGNGITFIEDTWVLYTVIAACILIISIIIVILYDLIIKCRSLNGQEISDGGPPASPSHQHFYSITVTVDEASETFDTKQSSLRVEILDNFNQYLTSILIPCFVFKFKNNNYKSSIQKSIELQANNQTTSNSESKSYNNNNNNNSNGYRSLTALYDNWTDVQRSQTLNLRLVRRNPLNNIASVRLSHDCFKPNAFITLKSITIQNSTSYETCSFDLQRKPLRAIHPCPPTNLQVFRIQEANPT